MPSNTNYNDTVKDLQFKTDSNYNRILLSGPARIKQVVTMLFNMVPGMDEYNPTKGLNIAAKLFNPVTENVRDTDYENEIASQFSQYTDLTVTNVIAMSVSGYFTVFFTVSTPEGVYEILLANKLNELTVLLTDAAALV